MHMPIQNRSDLYKMLAPLDTPNIVAQGIYAAKLVEVRRFVNTFGERIGLVFEIIEGAYQGELVMESAALKANPRGKLAELLRGIGGNHADLLTAHELIGRACRVAIKHEQNRQGKTYAAVASTFP